VNVPVYVAHMVMIEFYPEIWLTHIAAIAASGALFFLRGLGLFAGHRWPRRWPVRMTAYTIDTALLTTALMLTTVVQQYPFVHGWLTAKVVLLVIYIVLGYVAYWRAPVRSVRLACWIAALGVYGFIVSVALARHPLGFVASIVD